MDIYENNPVEYLNNNDLNIYDIHRRNSLLKIVIHMANNGLFMQMIQILEQHLQVAKDDL